MKIAIITGITPFEKKNRDGGPTAIFNYVNCLSKKGHKVDVFATKVKNNEIEKGSYFKQKITSNINLIKLKIFNHENRNFLIKDGSLERMENSIKAANVLKKFKWDRYDIIHIFHMTQAVGPILKLDLTQRTIISPMMPGKFYEKYQKVPVEYLKLEKRICQKSQYFQVASNAESNLLRKYYQAKKSKIFIHKYGLDLNIFKFLERKEISLKKINILSANAIRPQKNQIFFVGFVKECLEEGILPLVHIVGNTDNVGRKSYDAYKNNFIEKIKKEKLEKFFKIHGYLEQTKLNSLAKSMDLAIYPSVMETFGMAVLESICMGIPTIVFNDIPAYREFIVSRKNGIIVPRNINGVINAIKELADNDKLYQYISNQGKQMRKKYSWDKATDQLLGSYRTIIADSKK